MVLVRAAGYNAVMFTSLEKDVAQGGGMGSRLEAMDSSGSRPSAKSPPCAPPPDASFNVGSGQVRNQLRDGPASAGHFSREGVNSTHSDRLDHGYPSVSLDAGSGSGAAHNEMSQDADGGAPDASLKPVKASTSPITVRTTTAGGVQEASDFDRDAVVRDLRRMFRTLNGKQYKLLSSDGRELDNEDRIAAIIDSEDSTELHLTKVNVLHPVDIEMLNSIETKKDAFQCEVFPLGVFKVAMGSTKYGGHQYSTIVIDDPQPSFHTESKLEPYRAGYDYFDTVENYTSGTGRARYRMLSGRQAELEAELTSRLPEFRVLSAQIFENPNRIYKLRSFMDPDLFPCNRENLHRFLNIFFDILTDKSSMLL